jgi:hypothetical protein
MDSIDWLKYLTMALCGVLLVILSVKKITDSYGFKIKLSHSFILIIRYLGLFIMVYSIYCLLIDMIIYR